MTGRIEVEFDDDNDEEKRAISLTEQGNKLRANYLAERFYLYLILI